MFRALLVVTCLTAVAVAQPSPQQEAKQHFDLASAAEKDGRYRDAIDEYEKAYALVPHVDVLFNIATDFEHVQDWAAAADYYQRYLTERTEPAPDAAAVRRKIRELRARVPAEPDSGDPTQPNGPNGQNVTTGPNSATAPVEPPTYSQPLVVTTPGKPESPWAESPWHAGASYGFGFGDAPTERYLFHGGLRFAQRVDVDLIGGNFGRNDLALGVMGRVVLMHGRYYAPFLRAIATIGAAKQDSSSMAGTRFPFGFEAGGGIDFGVRGRVELAAGVRWVRGGWDAADTTAPSYVNDSMAFAIDLGITFDFSIIAGAR
jgi:hypothetical protein